MTFLPTVSSNSSSSSSSSTSKPSPNEIVSSCTPPCHKHKMASHSMILFFCFITFYDAFLSYQYGRSMRQLILTEYPLINDASLSTMYPLPEVRKNDESHTAPLSPYRNRIGSPVNQFYYYDSSISSREKNRDNTNAASSAAAIAQSEKLIDDDDYDDDMYDDDDEMKDETTTAVENLR